MQSGSTPKQQDYYSDLQTPEIDDILAQIEPLVQQGVLSPQEAQTIMQGESAMGGITLDPELKQAQLEALSSLQDISDQGGFNLTDRANLNKIANEEAIQNRGSREAILQNANARGMGGSGLELMSQLQNQQDSATRKSARDTDVAAIAQQRALDALMQRGNLANQMETQDFNRQAQTAQANDSISRFNAQTAQEQVNLNTAAGNDAAEKNLAVRQGIADNNAGIKTQNNQALINARQQEFENQLKKRNGQSGVAANNSSIQGANSDRQANATNQAIGTAATVAGLYFGGPAGAAAGKEAADQVTKKKKASY